MELLGLGRLVMTPLRGRPSGWGCDPVWGGKTVRVVSFEGTLGYPSGDVEQVVGYTGSC